jgi:hypothetical protein
VGYAYRIAAVLLAVAAYFFIRWSRSHSPRPWSALAVAAGAFGILHPTIWTVFSWQLTFHATRCLGSGRGDDEIMSFTYSAMVLGPAIVAIVRIARSKGRLRGIPFCIVGFTAAGFVFLNWLWLFFTWVNAYR